MVMVMRVMTISESKDMCDFGLTHAAEFDANVTTAFRPNLEKAAGSPSQITSAGITNTSAGITSTSAPTTNTGGLALSL